MQDRMRRESAEIASDPAEREEAEQTREWARYPDSSWGVSKRLTADGNIGRRRSAVLIAQDFGLRLAMRLLRFGGHGGGSAHREKLFGRDAETCGLYRWLRGDGLPGDSRTCACPARTAKGTGERCTLAHIDSKKRRYACNEIKLLVKEFGTDRTARDGRARAATCATPQPEQRGGLLNAEE
jgi:hypothetical protein